MNVLLVYLRYFIRPDHYKCVGWITLGIAGGAIAFPLSFVSASNVLLGFCLLPFVILTNGKQRINYIYLVAILMMGSVAYIYAVRTFYFFALAFYILFLLELMLGRINSLVLFLLAFMSPFFNQIVIILGFPIRLQLSDWAGKLLSAAGMMIHVEGNVMLLNGTAFSVDEACMGLNMLATSLLMGVFLIAHQYHTRKLKLGFLPLTVFFSLVLLLNVVSNLLRIVMLVLFRIAPGHPLHEMMGIFCMLLYVVVPLYFLGRWMISRLGKPFSQEARPIQTSIFTQVLITALALATVWTGWQIRHERTHTNPEHAHVQLEGFQPVDMENGITKMFNKNILVYIKSIPEFFSGEHTPLICWKGSGYTFKSVKTIAIDGHEIYCGQLHKPGAILYTAWWYTNGNTHTIDQLTWRLEMFQGKPGFCLVNVTASTEATLRTELERIFSKSALSRKQ